MSLAPVRPGCRRTLRLWHRVCLQRGEHPGRRGSDWAEVQTGDHPAFAVRISTCVARKRDEVSRPWKVDVWYCDPTAIAASP